MNAKDNYLPKISRRRFLNTAGAAAAFSIVPRYVLGGPGYTAPSDKLNIAIIGSGGQGIENMKELLGHSDVQVMAICDVAEETDYSQFYYGGKGGRKPATDIVTSYYSDRQASSEYNLCVTYTDFRHMLDKEKSIDAVLVATPDHNHAVTVMAAIRHGKHVYCEKPLTHSVYETRKITEAAAKAGVATQMGNQGNSGEGIRMTVEWIRDGAIGPVREVHAWSADGTAYGCRTGRPSETPPVPPGMDWDLWIGPAPYRPYHSVYAPFTWRDWWDFGTDAIGDMGCHNMDPAFWALELGPPSSVYARPVMGDAEMTPYASTVHYQFPARGNMPPVKMTWYSNIMPPRPDDLESNRELTGDGNGILFVGDKGKIMCGGWGGTPRLIPESSMKAYERPAKTLPRSPGHHREWIDACKGGKPAGANFSYAGPMTETVLLGVVAIRTRKYLEWDAVNLKATNCPEADQYIRPEYRKGWEL
jgi:predicted dehydrogenase